MLFWDVKHRRIVVSITDALGQTVGPIFRRQRVQALVWTLNIQPTVYPETSVANYHCSLRKVAEERRSHVYRCGKLQLLTVVCLLCIRLLFLSAFLLLHVYCFTALCVLLYCCLTHLPYVYLLYYVCPAVLHTLVAGLLARSQYAEGPASGHFRTGFSWFPCV